MERSDLVRCADITYNIPVCRGFLYPVAIMDGASRHVPAWRLSNTLDMGFCTDALEEVLTCYGAPAIVNPTGPAGSKVESPQSLHFRNGATQRLTFHGPDSLFGHQPLQSSNRRGGIPGDVGRQNGLGFSAQGMI